MVVCRAPEKIPLAPFVRKTSPPLLFLPDRRLPTRIETRIYSFIYKKINVEKYNTRYIPVSAGRHHSTRTHTGHTLGIYYTHSHTLDTQRRCPKEALNPHEFLVLVSFPLYVCLAGVSRPRNKMAAVEKDVMAKKKRRFSHDNCAGKETHSRKLEISRNVGTHDGV